MFPSFSLILSVLLAAGYKRLSVTIGFYSFYSNVRVKETVMAGKAKQENKENRKTFNDSNVLYFLLGISATKDKHRPLMYLRGLVALGLLLDQLSLWVNCENSAHWNADFLIGKHILYEDVKIKGSIFPLKYDCFKV